ncbi:hypothetical protein C5167_050410 [Papaver somniferum]|uniref:Uncharacterized protein n=1 Tax=Papaver somniferum TaxID=3469 RepID=A0A4Y7KS04_PAPSO|nr:hypothetical protein C5167_050410 [Papaver somniferum]
MTDDVETKELGLAKKEIEENKKNEKEKVEETVTMPPWEQHSAVISMPRFDYNAPSSLMDYSHSGFFITCSISTPRRRVCALSRGWAHRSSSTLLGQCAQGHTGSTLRAGYIRSLSTSSSENSETSNAKKRKICSGEVGSGNGAESKRTNDGSGESTREATPSSPKMDVIEEKGILSLVKLTRSGLLLFTFPRSCSPDTVDIVSKIFESLGSGNLKPLVWCHRIFPIQATCLLKDEDLRTVVSKLVQDFVGREQNKFEKPLKFAVGYNRRGVDETEMKNKKTDPKYTDLLALLDRNKCFSVVAGVVKEIVADAVVDLKSPELGVFIEVLPVSGIPNGSLVVAVSVLPHNLFTSKPKLCVKALTADTKTANGEN